MLASAPALSTMWWDTAYLPSRYVIMFISNSPIIFGGYKVGCHQNAKESARVRNSVLQYRKVQKMQKGCKICLTGWKSLFKNRIVAIGLVYGCVLLCRPLKLVCWWLPRFRSLWADRWVTYNCISQLYVHITILSYSLGRNSYRNEVVVSCCFIGQGLHLCCFFAGEVLPLSSRTLLYDGMLHIYYLFML